MGGESKYIHAEEYVKKLLQINCNCKIIFLQTDDYNCYLEIENYLRRNNFNINIITLCKENMKGGVVVNSINFNGLKDLMNIDEKCEHFQNKDYIIKTFNDVIKNKSVNQMNNQEKYNHTLEMLIGIDIVLKSERCICDYSSNVSRFIKLAHKDSSNVYNINNINKDINWDSKICPAYELN